MNAPGGRPPPIVQVPPPLHSASTPLDTIRFLRPVGKEGGLLRYRLGKPRILQVSLICSQLHIFPLTIGGLKKKINNKNTIENFHSRSTVKMTENTTRTWLYFNRVFMDQSRTRYERIVTGGPAKSSLIKLELHSPHKFHFISNDKTHSRISETRPVV